MRFGSVTEVSFWLMPIRIVSFISVVTLAELRHGIERLPAGRRRKRLNEWLQDEL
jgi:hypothetical protein